MTLAMIIEKQNANPPFWTISDVYVGVCVDGAEAAYSANVAGIWGPA
jgi:hypothetical protein